REVRPRRAGVGARRQGCGSRSFAGRPDHAGASRPRGGVERRRRRKHVHAAHPGGSRAGGSIRRASSQDGVSTSRGTDMKRVLVIEDEEGLLEGLAHNLRFEGYDVLTAKDGHEGLKMALKQKPDVVLLDIMLPQKDGFTVLKELRQRHRDIPVLVMTARNFEADVLKGFDLGADDYVTKPFGIKELIARVKRLVARGPMNTGAPGTTIYAFGDVEVRFEPREVLKAGTQVALSFKEFELLKYLIEHRGRTVSREELLEEIWGVDEDLGVTTRTVDTHVSNLRSKLGAGFAQPFIVAVHKVGYKFIEPAGANMH